MPALTFKNVSKTFGDNTVIDAFSADIHDGEFLVLLGPSGCGKSTLLRMIAGLSDITSGDLLFDGSVANDWEPKQRGVAFVFQTYALYPHMTVRENIAFPLIMDAFRKWYHLPIVNIVARHRLMKRADIAERTLSIARQLELEPLLDRRPASLSGGQRQRVALARALVRNPALYLLDEPLSNLDAKLRTQMRSEISALHHKVGKTFVYVTHDQVEAMTMATRIIVMNKGIVQQVDTPDEIYDHPANTFVARFVGSPPMNLIPASVRNNALQLSGRLAVEHAAPLPPRRELTFGVRPEKLTLHPAGEGRLPAQVAVVERLGAETVIGCRLMTGEENKDQRLLEHDLVFVRVSGNPKIKIGELCSLDYQADDVLWFDIDNGDRIFLDQE
ncbi:Glycerol-3-phosphate transporter ATP-binding subunit (plasmid) [Neorhizobium galegae bv. officinalis bv. officinalis str. HAMBI 1141]|uniref:Glycerol-3-phosphate transporter ATP-binding subunit n=1 Tax=Neorhizobium galegae bv. officinalis bv. officinalis str. HAMBI 1141 TaxID=1028801 RepID=A0A068THH9_NEOGA|nr:MULTISPECIES: ATP-binding cassette domain-containing protein [Neorhizobium]MCJ9669398.1 ATP-binding cassette domain-containing protein [Neorhizobium sp. SHOUNA12B]MCJ9745266.1 ATP-binding cassette domain-containing protein [Neorhizobium sp. SHOUNA12A]CDN57531.1 Glycerol-3-phosphate transporter ATP-binding subunit [Neorhizobium galegae bv. officinalis bv. officinalis str. HAMBI 1141]